MREVKIVKQDEAKEILGKQLELLAEVSKTTNNLDVLAEISKAMVLIKQNL